MGESRNKKRADLIALGNFVRFVSRANTRSPDVRKVLAAVRDCTKYQLSEAVFTTASQVSHYRFPYSSNHHQTWLEYVSDDTTVATGVLVSGHQGVMLTWCGRLRLHVFNLQDGIPVWTEEEDRAALDREFFVLSAAMEMINHPRITDHQRVPSMDKYVRSSGRVVRSRTVEFTMVDVHVTRTQGGAVSSGGAGRSGPRLHQVRPFVRRHPTQDRPVLVAGHWRGDPALGTRLASGYRVLK